MKRLLAGGACLALLLLAGASGAAPITYQFTAMTTNESRGMEDGTGGFMSVDNPAERVFAAGTLISGQFTYDPSATGSPFGPEGSGATIFPAVSDFGGTADGNTFSGPTGAVLIADNGTQIDQDPRDLFQVVAGDASDDFAGFTVNTGTRDFALNLVNLFFIEGATPYAPFADGLPATLPPPTPEATRLRLGFDDLGAPGIVQLVFAEPVSLAVIPVPPAFALFGSGLALLGWLRRRAAA